MTAFQVLLTKDHEINAIEQIVYLHEDVIEAMQEYAKIKCRKQKRICAEGAKVRVAEKDITNQGVFTLSIVDKDSILNSEEPKFD